jgi:6-phosphogluconolactonase
VRRALFLGLLVAPLVLVVFGVSAYGQQTNFVYSNNGIAGPNTVSAFSVAADGTLTQVAGSPFVTGGLGDGGGSVAVDRIVIGGDRLYAANDASYNISGFAISPTTGALTPLPGSPYPFGGSSSSADLSLAWSPDGRFLFAMDSISHRVTSFAAGADGSLSSVAHLGPLALEPSSIRVTPDGRFLMVPFFENEVGVFRIATDGSLAEVVGSPFPADAGILGNPESADVNCAGNLLYVGSQSLGTTVYGYAVGPDGTLTPLPGSPLVRDDVRNTNEVLFSADSRYLFVAGAFSSSISVFSVGGDGSLAPVPGSPFAVAGPGVFMNGLSTDAAGRFLYTSTTNPVGIDVLLIGDDGALTLVPGSPFVTGAPVNNQSNVAAYPAKRCAVPAGGSTCVVDDATGDTFSEVTDASSQLYGRWTYRVAATGVTITGTANFVHFDAGHLLVSHDLDFSAENPTYSMEANINFASNRGTVRVRRRGNSEPHVLHDGNLDDDPPCR